TVARLVRMISVARRTLRRSWSFPSARFAATGNSGALAASPTRIIFTLRQGSTPGACHASPLARRAQRLGRLVGENLRDVETANAGALASEAAADVHQAGVVGGGADLRLGLVDAADLVVQHRD